jgi:CarboxypepD_reg-like domain
MIRGKSIHRSFISPPTPNTPWDAPLGTLAVGSFVRRMSTRRRIGQNACASGILTFARLQTDVRYFRPNPNTGSNNQTSGSVHMPGLLFCLFLLSGGSAVAGTTGILARVVRDKATHELIPEVNVTIFQLQQGAATDIDGAFQIPNIAAGHYEVRFSHIGHRAYTLKNVAIQPDLRTRDLEPTDVELPEVTVVLEKPLIQTDVTGSRFQVTDVELNAFPVDNVTDILHLKPGVTMEGNVRGGRADEVLYPIDGLPVKDVLAGEMSVNLPKSSIPGMSITTGGFEPEYGNALSGVVNVVTRSGTNESHYQVKADKDNLFGGEQNSNTSDFDLSASGAPRIFARPPRHT